MTLYSYKKADRLRKRQEFIEIQKKGKRISNPFFIALVAPGKTPRTRLGITASKKVGKAIVRNRLKRLTREYFRQNRHRCKQQWDINLIVKQKAADLPSDQVFSALKDIFDRIPETFEY